MYNDGICDEIMYIICGLDKLLVAHLWGTRAGGNNFGGDLKRKWSPALFSDPPVPQIVNHHWTTQLAPNTAAEKQGLPAQQGSACQLPELRAPKTAISL